MIKEELESVGKKLKEGFRKKYIESDPEYAYVAGSLPNITKALRKRGYAVDLYDLYSKSPLTKIETLVEDVGNPVIEGYRGEDATAAKSYSAYENGKAVHRRVHARFWSDGPENGRGKYIMEAHTEYDIGSLNHILKRPDFGEGYDMVAEDLRQEGLEVTDVNFFPSANRKTKSTEEAPLIMVV